MSISRHMLLKARLTAIRRDLDEILVRLTPEILPWAPAQGMRTVSGQLVEIIATEIQLIACLKDQPWISDDEAAEMIGDCDNVDTLRKALVDLRRQTLEYLDSFTEAQLAEEVSFGAGWLGSLDLPTIPRAEVFLNIADHEWYHTGQLTSYLWSRGDNPYEW
jgi:uncharacterized damage-inducible protein DinB